MTQNLSDEDEREIQEIEQLMREKATLSLTKEELRKQRISWVMGMLPFDSTMTRSEVERLLDSRYG